jgi:hypothetical protein
MAEKATYISRIRDAVAAMTIERATCIAPKSELSESAHEVAMQIMRGICANAKKATAAGVAEFGENSRQEQ